VGAFLQELFSLSLYKRSQGRIARQATFAAMAVIVALGAWSLREFLKGAEFTRPAQREAVAESEATGDSAAVSSAETAASGTTEDPATSSQASGVRTALYVSGIPLVVLLAGLWISFRLVHLPQFADFLISVEGEMNKVSWPARGELFRASVVVMFVIFFLAGILFVYDLALAELMKGIEAGLGIFG
jgi:preprotein translocase subunit SecE